MKGPSDISDILSGLKTKKIDVQAEEEVIIETKEKIIEKSEIIPDEIKLETVETQKEKIVQKEILVKEDFGMAPLFASHRCSALK